MSVSYHASYACPEIGSTYHLWGSDPYLASRLLAAIQGEAINRGLSADLFYDPYIPSLLQGIRVEGVGSFTTRADDLSPSARLIDCSALAAPNEGVIQSLTAFASSKRQLTDRIAQLGNCLHRQIELRKELSLPMVKQEELTLRAVHLAQKQKRGIDGQIRLPIFSYGEHEAVYRLPFDASTEIISLEGSYDLPRLFLDALLTALAERPCQRVVLEHTLTHQPLGVWLPTEGRCYLIGAPTTIASTPRSLNRYLHPHTQACRHGHRALQTACHAWEERLKRLLDEYRALCAREEQLYASLYENNRLQNFRKRLLIDLFCPSDNYGSRKE